MLVRERMDGELAVCVITRGIEPAVSGEAERMVTACSDVANVAARLYPIVLVCGVPNGELPIGVIAGQIAIRIGIDVDRMEAAGRDVLRTRVRIVDGRDPITIVAQRELAETVETPGRQG